MRRMMVPGICAAALLASGCATTRFAPPVVNLSDKMKVVYQAGKPCRSQIVVATENGITANSNVAGARALIDNFIYVYRCQAHSAADGRQAFEVPALLVAAGTVTAAALGAGTDVSIIGGATSSVLANGKAYYSPQQKAGFYDHALDALLCIKTEAVGIAAFDTSKAGNLFGMTVGTGGAVRVEVEDQYFDMVSAALFSVERILAQRLSTAGTFDPAGLMAEIKALQKEVEAAEAAKKKAATATPGATQTTETQPAGSETEPSDNVPADDKSDPAVINLTEEDSVSDATKARAIAGVNALLGLSNAAPDYVTLELNLLRPKLQQCVVRAKL